MKLRPIGEEYLRGLQKRGLNGVKYIVSDDHDGLQAALNAVMPGVLWQRCQCHLQRNAASYAPKITMRRSVHNDIRDIFNAPNRQEAEVRLKFYVAKNQKAAPKLSEWMEENLPEGLTVFALPAEHRRRMRTTNMLERVHKVEQFRKELTVKTGWFFTFPFRVWFFPCLT